MLFRLTSLLAERGACGGRRCAGAWLWSRVFGVSVGHRTPHGHAYAAYAVCRASRMRDTACVRLSVNHEHFEGLRSLLCAFLALLRRFVLCCVSICSRIIQVSGFSTTHDQNRIVCDMELYDPLSQLRFHRVTAPRAHVCSLSQAWSNR